MSQIQESGGNYDSQYCCNVMSYCATVVAELKSRLTLANETIKMLRAEVQTKQNTIVDMQRTREEMQTEIVNWNYDKNQQNVVINTRLQKLRDENEYLQKEMDYAEGELLKRTNENRLLRMDNARLRDLLSANNTSASN